MILSLHHFRVIRDGSSRVEHWKTMDLASLQPTPEDDELDIVWGHLFLGTLLVVVIRSSTGKHSQC